MENRIFMAEEDLNRIEVLSSENVSIRNPRSIGRSPFHDVDKTSRSKSVSFSPTESIELEESLRRQSSPSVSTHLRVSTTPTSMMRRWSMNMSRFCKDKPTLRSKSIFRLPSRRLFQEVDEEGEESPMSLDDEIEELLKDIQQHQYLMQFNPMSAQSRLKMLRCLPQPMLVKRLLKQKLSLTLEQQRLIESRKFSEKVVKFLLNVVFSIFLWAYKLQRFLTNTLTFWNQSMKTIEGRFGSNVSSYFRFLRCLFAFNLVLFIFPLSFITLPQILYNDDVRRRNNNLSTDVSVLKYSHVFEIFEMPGEHDWNAMDFLTGEGMLKTSLMFYGSYSNATFGYRDSKSTYSIPTAYFMTMMMLYLSVFVVISASVARTYRESYIKASYSIRNLYALKICFSWDYNIMDEKAADLKHFAIYTELQAALRKLRGCKVRRAFWVKVWIFCTQTMAHFLVGAIIPAAVLFIWILINSDARNKNSSWSSLYIVTLVNLTLHILQMVFSWISRMEDYRSPIRTLHVSIVRNFLLESAVIAVLLYYWITKEHVEGWETVIGQEIYRLIISDCLIRLLIFPTISCFRIFILTRFFPKLERPDFDISFKSLGLVFNQTLLWIGLFFAPLLAGIMVLKMVLLFNVNKATIIYLCKSPRHVWRSAQTQTLYLLLSFLSLLGVIIAFGYIMTQISVSQRSGPFRDQSYMFQIFIDHVLGLRRNTKIWSVLMFAMRPAVVGFILIVMSLMVYFLYAKACSNRDMVKLLKEMIDMHAKDREFLLANITQIKKDLHSNLKSVAEEEEEEGEENRADRTDDLITERSPTWKYSRKFVRNSQADRSNENMATPKSVVNSVNECVLRNRNV